MIKFISSSSSGRKMLGLIISEGNVENLKKGFPIHFNAEDMGLIDIQCNEVIVCYFSTEKEAYEYFNKNGYITKDTKIKEEKEPTKQ